MAADEDVEEWLETPPPPRSPLVVAVLVAVGVLVAVLARAPKHPSPTPPSVPTRVALPAPSSAGAPQRFGAPTCPEADDGQSVCATTSHVPAGFLHAVEAQFPGVRTETARTDLIRQSAYSPPDPLWYRLFTARSDDVELLIQIRQSQPGDHDGLVTDASRYATTSRITLTRAHHWAVLISVVSIGVPAPTARQLRALAADDRLVSV